MSDCHRTGKSLWEHAGFPGVPNYHQEHGTEDIDRVFKAHLAQLHNRKAETVELVEAVLSWTVLRDDELRERLRYYYDYGVLNQATNREAGPGEFLEYHEQVDQIRQEASADAVEMLANGASETRANWVQQYTTQRRHDEETFLRKPPLPGAKETWAPEYPGLKSLGWAAAWTSLTFTLVAIANLLGFAGPIADFLTTAPWVGAGAGLIGFLSTAWLIHGRYRIKAISWNKWLAADARGNWPVLVWGLLATSVTVAFPVWVAAVWIPLSASLPLLNGRFRLRLLESVGGVNGPMLEASELLGREVSYASNIFVPANSTIQAEGPALGVSLPIRSRDGSSGQSIDSSQETLLHLAEHTRVESSGLAVDVHRITGALLLDALVAVTGSDELRLVAQYGAGPMRVAARAVAIVMGQEPLTTNQPFTVVKPGRAVASWFEGEARAYSEFAHKHLCEADAALALSAAAQVLAETAEAEFPHLVRYRLETIAYALSCATSPSCSSSC